MAQINLPLPRHDAKHVQGNQYTHGMQLAVGAVQEVGNHVITVQFRVFLEGELRVRLVAFGGEAHVVKLDFVNA